MGVLLVVVFAAFYIFIPAKIHFRKTMYIQTSPNSAARFLLAEKEWHKWWPEKEGIKNDSLFTFKEYEYAVNWKMIMGDSIRIKTKDGYINSLLNIIPINKDSTGFQWEGESATEKNIFKRISNYVAQQKLQNNASEIFTALKGYLEDDENVYGINIEHKMVIDTLLISTKKIFTQYPNTEQVYEMINDLKKYISIKSAEQTNPPMLHVVQDNGLFKTMVALPINKEVPNTVKFIIKKMIAGKILVAQTTGGSSNAEEAIKKIEAYMDDYKLMSPAISFQSLVTDRQNETDSTKWVTKIYYPVI